MNPFRRPLLPFLLVLFALLALGVASAERDTATVDYSVPARVEIAGDPDAVEALVAAGIDVDAVFHDWARVYVVREQLEKLRGLGLTVTLLPNDAPAKAEEARRIAATREARPPVQRGSVAAEYHTYDTLTADLQQIAADHPDIVRLQSIGQSVQGRELWMVKITDNPDLQEYEPEFAYISSMHGDEVVGKEVLYNLIDYLTDNYGSLSRVTELVDSTEIWIMPSMNPDGTEIGIRGNANNTDLNRDFPDQFIDPVNDVAGRAPETAAVMQWRAGEAIDLSANFHGGALVANYPLDSNPAGTSTFSPAPAPDHPTFQSLARTYADNNIPMSTSNDHPAWDDGITNGADWYAINGGMQDWQYVYEGGFEILIEISNQKWPAASSLPGFWDDNLESLLLLMERVHEGVRGIVTDAETGQPLEASIRIDANPHVTYSDREIGDYHRVLLPGTYTVTATAPGRETLAIPGVVVGAGPATVLDIALGPAPVDLQPIASAVLDGGNSTIDVGEIADLDVTLANFGRAATAVNARLISTGYDAVVTQPDSLYPDLDTSDSAGPLGPAFEIAANDPMPEGRKLGFAVEWDTAEGRGVSEAFFLEVGTGTVDTIVSADVPQTIGNFASQLAESDIVVPLESSVSNVTDVKVSIDFTHTYIGDVEIDLLSPAGTTVRLHNRGGGSADDIVGTYGVDLTPWQPLDAFVGEDSQGTWTLRIFDDVIGDGGQLNAWSLEITGRPAETTTPEIKLREISRHPGGTRLEWWPYPGLTGYRIYRSVDPSSAAAFVDVTSLDPDTGDTLYDDAAGSPLLFFIVTGVGPNGEGPKGHFGE